ncbi:MAG: ADP-ribosylglycohydrolase family protein [Planctomycetaceae bacterium]|nr:ADP-ribosylglycohydrolase family protein [Planctomycetaceae bacterium]
MKTASVKTKIEDRIAGTLLGTAVGDAIGLPLEGLSRRRVKRLFPGTLRHRFFCGRGMVSDDTEHTFLVAQTLLDESNDVERFSRKLAWRLRWWFARLPAGVGMATAKACLKLWCGFSPKRSGVFSAGNGPAMRAAIFGAVMANTEKRHAFLKAATRMTHTDPKALTGAMAAADIAAWIIRRDFQTSPLCGEIIDLLLGMKPQDETWRDLVGQMKHGWENDMPVLEFADRLGLQKGVSGYVYHTVPVAIYAWRQYFGDYRKTLESAIECGGDTDTVGAIAGALAGTTVGESGIPQDWIDGICDVPINIPVLRNTATRLAELANHGTSREHVRYCWPLAIPRNLFFLTVVLAHGLRRLLPPY